jgi:hypothetical protein
MSHQVLSRSHSAGLRQPTLEFGLPLFLGGRAIHDEGRRSVGYPRVGGMTALSSRQARRSISGQGRNSSSLVMQMRTSLR